MSYRMASSIAACLGAGRTLQFREDSIGRRDRGVASNAAGITRRGSARLISSRASLSSASGPEVFAISYESTWP